MWRIRHDQGRGSGLRSELPCGIGESQKRAAYGVGCEGDTSPLGGFVLDFSYGFNLGTANNGNVAQITNNLNTARTQSFTYDELNRIKTAQTQASTGTNAWGLSFGYDIWGNLLSASVTQGSAPMLSVSVNANNRITNAGFSHDTAGNMMADGVNSYLYDAESRLKTAAGVTYTYDGIRAHKVLFSRVDLRGHRAAIECVRKGSKKRGAGVLIV